MASLLQAGPARRGPASGVARGRLLRVMTRKTSAWLVLLALASVASAGAATLLPAALGRTLDVILAATTGRTGTAGLWTWVAGCGALIAVVAAGNAFVQFGTGTATGRCTGWLRHELLRHILTCGPRMTSRFAPGDTVSRLIGGTVDAAGAPCGVVLAVTATIPAFGSVVALGLIDPWLAAAFLAGMPVVTLVLRAFMRDTSDVILRYQQAQGAIAARLVDTMTGARTIAAAGTCEQEIARVLGPLPGLRACGDQTWRVQGRIAAQSGVLVSALQVLVLAVGGIELTMHRITPGGLLAASQYAALGAGIGAAIGQFNRLARGRAGGARVTELLDVAAPEQGSERLPAGRGQIEFKGVTVYASDAVVIENLDLTVPAGASVAVVGGTGSGKSTITALAGRLIDPSSGEVLLDGVPLTRLACTELRTAVSYAFERPALLGRTIHDMIAFGLVRPRDESIAAAAVAARADRFIERLPERYQTPLARAPLSGGEVQRLGLARALAHGGTARVLVLDDATSSLDTVTEMEVSQALTHHHGDRTKLIVTHRAATAADADLVAWLDAGRLQALAPHEELWKNPRYQAVFGACADTPGNGRSA
jgi:ATP-binding cassette, subfamily B, bacterial